MRKNIGLWYAVTMIDGKAVKMHRMLLDPSSDTVVDHKNNDGLDNRRQNLRVCSPKENARNARVRLDSVTGFKGVQRRGIGKYRVRIQVDGKRHSIGDFSSLKDAVLAYNEAAKNYFGSFAFLNSLPT